MSNPTTSIGPPPVNPPLRLSWPVPGPHACRSRTLSLFRTPTPLLCRPLVFPGSGRWLKSWLLCPTTQLPSRKHVSQTSSVFSRHQPFQHTKKRRPARLRVVDDCHKL